MNSPYQKIISLNQAAEISARLRNAGQTVGFTNGVFDCLHYGHIQSFMGTKKLCDKLFVGMNSDASVKRLKGPARPIQDETTRSVLIASMEFVDFVVVFDTDTALPLVEIILPDVIAKEGYEISKWPEGQFVQSRGGQAVTLPRIDGYSTTEIIKRMFGLNSK